MKGAKTSEPATIRPHIVWADRLRCGAIGILSVCCAAALIGVLITIAVQASPIAFDVGPVAFLTGSTWMPVDFTGSGASFGIANFIAASLATSALALVFALVISLGTALFLSCSLTERARHLACSFIDLLAGIPSVVYGFIGLCVVVKALVDAGLPNGNCILAASIVLTVMILPFMVSTMTESMVGVRDRYFDASLALGVGKWYAVYAVVLPVSLRLIWPSVMMAFARAMGETMAVMMVAGNANLFPTLFGKGETIASLIALEMGTAEAGSAHMHALFAAGFVLLAIVLVVDLLSTLAQRSLTRRMARRGLRASALLLGCAGGVVVRIWAICSAVIVAGIIAFLFGYVFWQGAGCISWEFLTESPSGAVLGTQGGIFPAIMGSAWFTGCALVIAVPLSVSVAAWRVFLARGSRLSALMGRVISVSAGAPSIVMGLFAYAALVRDAGLGRCVLAGGVALALMIIPFIEVRVEKAFREFPDDLLRASASLGVSKAHALRTLVWPYCAGEVLGAIVLGGLYALGAAAPLIFTGGVAFAPVPTAIDSPAMSLPLHLYLMLAQGNTIPQVYATAFVLMVIVLICNIVVNAYTYIRKARWMRS